MDDLVGRRALQGVGDGDLASIGKAEEAAVPRLTAAGRIEDGAIRRMPRSSAWVTVASQTRA